MKKSSVLVATLAGIAMLFLSAPLYAGTNFEDVIKLNETSYKHTKGIIEFSHAKHVDEYKNGCGECHHNDKGEPLSDLKKGDDVKRCVECHSKPGEIKGKEAKGLSKEEKRQYHANALHDNCRNCHKAYNKKNNTKAAPTSCTKCHPKKKK
ncbi:hypothetical protein DENIS_2989 [Desulfonema ishimotonii]|uniref:Class III cytochrome C domain-containing protein n=1 Tax=Desulfonema ishimotonii TaxID=45657 RepID=A0A401FYK6_9BACT|nr:cytochrome c3 family protein [Desulfonema ishimotonii]GBC62026.1 hypothetical protein DENIS_2989 [Desulfonema ishimotonii]